MQKRKISILVAEDKEYMRTLIKKYIDTNPTTSINSVDVEYISDFCDNAEEAILRYVGGEHDIVIMDLHFDESELNGIVATTELLEANPFANIIGMASEGEARVEEFKCSGIRFFLEKVFQDSYLWSRIDAISEEIILKELNSPEPEKKGLFKKKK